MVRLNNTLIDLKITQALGLDLLYCSLSSYKEEDGVEKFLDFDKVHQYLIDELEKDIIVSNFDTFAVFSLPESGSYISVDSDDDEVVVYTTSNSGVYFPEATSEYENLEILIDKWEKKLADFFVIFERKKKENASIKLVIPGEYGSGLFHTYVDLPQSPYSLSLDDIEILYGEEGKDNFLLLENCITQEMRGLALLHGPPGTGKTSIIRSIIQRNLEESFFYFTAENLLSIGNADFISLMLQNKKSVVVMEDSETVLEQKDSRSSATQNILNLTDGILADVTQPFFLGTFNANIEHIDAALLRPGRCITLR